MSLESMSQINRVASLKKYPELAKIFQENLKDFKIKTNKKNFILYKPDSRSESLNNRICKIEILDKEHIKIECTSENKIILMQNSNEKSEFKGRDSIAKFLLRMKTIYNKLKSKDESENIFLIEKNCSFEKKVDYNSAVKHNNKGIDYFNKKRYEKALEEYNIALKINNQYDIAYNNRGIVYFNQGKYKEAIEDYNKALELNPNFENGYFNRGNVYFNQGKYKEAIEDYNKGLELNPNFENGYLNRGSAYFNIEKHTEALVDYDKFLELNPKDVYTYIIKSILYRGQGKYEKALEACNLAIKLDPTNLLNVYNEKGNIYKEQRKYDIALELYDKEIEINERCIDAYNNKADIYINLKQYEKALEEYSRLLNVTEDVDINLKKAKIYSIQGKYKNAIAEFNEIIRLNPDDGYSYICRGSLYGNEKQYELALNDFNNAVRVDFREGLTYRGLLYSKIGHIELALNDFNNAITIGNANEYTYLSRGYLYQNQEKFELALDDYNKAIEINKNYDIAYNSIGVIYHLKKDYDRALKNYNLAISLNSKDGYPYINKAKLYLEQKKYELALENCNEAIEIDHNLENAYLLRGSIYEIMENKSKAIEDYKKYISIGEKYFYSYIQNYKLDLKDKIKNLMFNLFVKITIIKKMKMTNSYEIFEVGHYTKIENLKFIVKPKAENKAENNESGRIRINNASYMNDPEEGEVFLKLLKSSKEDEKLQTFIDSIYKDKDIEENRGKRKIFKSKSKVFVTSFSKNIDESIPMWIHYSNLGKGCCLTFKNSFFDCQEESNYKGLLNMNDKSKRKNEDIDNKEDDNKKSYCLYEIEYVNRDKQLNDELKEAIEELGKTIIEISRLLTEENDSELENATKDIVKNVLDEVRFLFKDESYSYEQELRVVKAVYDDEGIEYTSSQEGFTVPHVYINLDKELEIEEVILGPKVENEQEAVTYLQYCGVKNVSKSALKYR